MMCPPEAIFQFLSTDKMGNFGDFFGGVFGFLASLLAIILSVRALSAASKARHEQAFLALFSDFSNSVEKLNYSYRSGGNPIEKNGREVFRIFYKRFIKYYEDEKEKFPKLGNVELIQNSWSNFFDAKGNHFGHYFRNLYTIVKYHRNSDLKKEKIHVDILRSKLSRYELAMLFYNCLGEQGKEKFKPLVEEYSLLEGMDHSLIINKDHESLYKKTAFKRAD